MGGFLRNKGLGSLLLVLVFCASCSSSGRMQVLAFFFDGVQVEEEKGSEDEVNSGPEPADSLLVALVDEHRIYWHEPYREKDCAACHDPYDRGIPEGNEMCGTCHDLEAAKEPFAHGPLAGGFCTECHSPHKSEVEHLLLAEKDQLCMKCHKPSTLVSEDFHSEQEENCSSCHGAHAADNPGLLYSNSCLECHGDPATLFTNLHGPVAAGFCAACHDSHFSPAPSHLKYSGDALCLSCHEKGEMVEKELHADLEGFQCSDCHHPHGGEDKYLLL